MESSLLPLKYGLFQCGDACTAHIRLLNRKAISKKIFSAVALSRCTRNAHGDREFYIQISPVTSCLPLTQTSHPCEVARGPSTCVSQSARHCPQPRGSDHAPRGAPTMRTGAPPCTGSTNQPWTTSSLVRPSHRPTCPTACCGGR